MRAFLFSMLLSVGGYAQTDISGMITCFKQGEKNNGAAVALIKASIAAFEVGNVFKERTMANGNMEATLKNGTVHLLSPDELKAAKEACGFDINSCRDSTAIRYAIKCYAVMAKERQADVPGIDYATALRQLEGEPEISTIYTLLGLEKNIRKFRNGTYVENLCAVVVWRGKDAVFHCNGLIDKKGKERSMNVLYYGRFQVVDEWDADPN
jgi:hypothetical protein